MNRKFYGNQYIGKTWRTFKLVLSGTWIGIKEIVHNPGKVLIAVLMLGLSTATLVQTSTPHRLMISDAWADLSSYDGEVKYVREVVEVKEEPAVIMERIAKCESGGKHYLPNGRINKLINVDKKTGKPTGTIDYGKWMLNDNYHEAEAVKLGYDIYTPEGNEKMAYHLYRTQGTEPWIWTKYCWANAK